jgi:hypothetical protein
MSELPETLPYQKVKAPVKQLACTNELCRCSKKGNCSAHEDIVMACSPKVWWQTCEPRVKWEKFEKLFIKLFR